MSGASKTVLTVLLVWTCCSTSMHSQVTSKKKSTEANEYCIECTKFNRLWLTMDSLENTQTGKLSILYIGGSHVQAGWIGHYLRESLMQWSPRSAWDKGLMLPYRLAQTNTPTHFRTEMSGQWNGANCAQSSWPDWRPKLNAGTGIEARTSSKRSSIQHVSYLPDSSKFIYNLFDVWTNATRSELQLQTAQNDSTCRYSKISTGWRISCAEVSDTFRLSFEADQNREVPLSYGGTYAHSMELKSSIVLNEWGHNGLHIEDLAALADLKAFMQIITRMQPDLILMGVGLNDAINAHGFDLARFAVNYERCLYALEKAAPDAAILLMSNTNVHNTSKNTRQNSMMIQEFLRSTALASHPAYFDLASATGGSENTMNWMENGWFKSDGIHFTPEGYQEISAHIFSALQDARENSRIQSKPDRE